MASSLAISMFMLASLAPLVKADAFLSATSRGELRKAEVEQALLSELSIIGSSPHIRRIEEALQPLYAAMPKNEYGNLEPSVVRYALHRYFVQKHGWHVRGLERGGGARNASLPANIMKDQAPSYIESLFEERLHSHGLNLKQVAVFASTLSELIRMEALDGLEYIYDAMEIKLSSSLAPWVFDDVVKGYLVAAIWGIYGDGEATPGEDLAENMAEVAATFRGWESTTMWAKDLRRTTDIATQQPLRNPFKEEMTFEQGLDFVEELVHRYSSFHGFECHSLKEMLVDMEHQGTGRVPLSKFYSGRSDQNWPFNEAVEYLRSLGALDESDPKRPSVVIANYLSSKSKCVAPSSFYSVCCHDECEGLLTQVELAIAGPAATPARLAEIVSGLGSDTIEAPRNFSVAQLSLLDDIAEHHGGYVPVHGRLFAQWMHHAYPRECPFPNLADTTNPLSPDEWMDHMDLETHLASDEEVKEHFAVPRNESMPGMILKASLPWTAVEELVTSREQVFAVGDGPRTWHPVRNFLILAVVVSALWPITRSSKCTWTSPVDEGKAHLV